MTRRMIIFGAAAIVMLAAGVGVVRLNSMARIATAYKAKALCSEIFLAGRDPETVLDKEFAGISPAVDRATARIDGKKRQVAASLLGLGRARAVYRDGYGCTIVAGGDPAVLPGLPPVAAEPWAEAPPVSGQAIQRIDYQEVEFVMNEAIDDDAAATRALLVAADGKIVAERYAPGFEEETPLLSWSMAKSVTASLVGAAVLRGYLDVGDPAPVPEWRGGDPRAKITWNDLLQMQSGLAFTEIYDDPGSDVSRMLFKARDAGSVAAALPAEYEPGEHWAYSSGTTNLIVRTLKQVLAERGVDLEIFAREALFGPIGAASFVLETDSSGTPIGSSYIYATARDWAKLGQLYLQGGVWEGERLLPQGWTDYVSRPAAASDGGYGAQFWLNHDGEDGRERYLPGLPEKVYYMAGHEGQYVFIIPDKNMVIVRLGMTRGEEAMPVVAPVAAKLYRAVGALAPEAAP